MRTFVAVEISNKDLIDSIERFQKKININAKPVEPENFHFTLQFLGEVSDETLQKVIQALRSIEFSSFELKLKEIGAFPKPKFPRVVWIGTDNDGGDRLKELAKDVQKVLEPLGFTPDKPFKPHLTIFRIKKKIGDISKDLESERMVDFGIQKVTNIKFKKSELTPNGPIYSDLEEVRAKE